MTQGAGLKGRGIDSPSGVANSLDSFEHGRTPLEIPDYQVEGLLARGGMGQVLKVRQLSTGALRVAKMIRGQADLEALERFGRELTVLGQINHPCVVKIFGAGQSQLGPYFIMELVEGQVLSECVSSPWDPTRLATFMARLARAIHSVHELGIIHRDLKPANIFVCAEDMPKVVDFGIARLRHSEALTLSGDALGTPAYMSPEQAAGRLGELGPWTDVWALGMISLQLLSARLPFLSTASIGMLAEIQMGSFRPIREMLPDLDPDLQEILSGALCLDASKRTRTAEAFAEDLERWLAGETPLAAQEARRKRLTGLGIYSTALGLSVALVLGSIYGYQWRSRRNAVQSAIQIRKVTEATLRDLLKARENLELPKIREALEILVTDFDTRLPWAQLDPQVRRELESELVELRLLSKFCEDPSAEKLKALGKRPRFRQRFLNELPLLVLACAKELEAKSEPEAAASLWAAGLAWLQEAYPTPDRKPPELRNLWLEAAVHWAESCDSTQPASYLLDGDERDRGAALAALLDAQGRSGDRKSSARGATVLLFRVCEDGFQSQRPAAVLLPLLESAIQLQALPEDCPRRLIQGLAGCSELFSGLNPLADRLNELARQGLQNPFSELYAARGRAAQELEAQLAALRPGIRVCEAFLARWPVARDDSELSPQLQRWFQGILARREETSGVWAPFETLRWLDRALYHSLARIGFGAGFVDGVNVDTLRWHWLCDQVDDLAATPGHLEALGKELDLCYADLMVRLSAFDNALLDRSATMLLRPARGAPNDRKELSTESINTALTLVLQSVYEARIKLALRLRDTAKVEQLWTKAVADCGEFKVIKALRLPRFAPLRAIVLRYAAINGVPLPGALAPIFASLERETEGKAPHLWLEAEAITKLELHLRELATSQRAVEPSALAAEVAAAIQKIEQIYDYDRRGGSRYLLFVLELASGFADALRAVGAESLAEPLLKIFPETEIKHPVLRGLQDRLRGRFDPLAGDAEKGQ